MTQIARDGRTDTGTGVAEEKRDVLGDVTGDVIVHVTGDVTGGVTGDVTVHVTGDVISDVIGCGGSFLQLRLNTQEEGLGQP